MKASAMTDDRGRENLKPLAVHATERTLKTLQLLKATHDEVSQRELLLIVEEVVEFRSRELARLLKMSLQFKKREQIDQLISEIFSLC